MADQPASVTVEQEWTLEELRRNAKVMRETATRIVRVYAERRCPAVAQTEVEAICRALGEISVGEAETALDRLQQEASE